MTVARVSYGFSQREMNSAALTVRENVKLFGAASASSA